MAKTINEINADHSARVGAIMTWYQDRKDDIRAAREPEDGSYLEHLTGDQRLGILRQQKLEQAQDAFEQTLEASREEAERYQAEVEKRRQTLKVKLFEVEDAGALARAALATEAELGVLMDTAADANNLELARAVFTAATRRGLGEHLGTYFDLDPEARGLYEEWSQLPDEAFLQRARENVERVVVMPSGEQLDPLPINMASVG